MLQASFGETRSYYLLLGYRRVLLCYKRYSGKKEILLFIIRLQAFIMRLHALFGVKELISNSDFQSFAALININRFEVLSNTSRADNKSCLA